MADGTFDLAAFEKLIKTATGDAAIALKSLADNLKTAGASAFDLTEIANKLSPALYSAFEKVAQLSEGALAYAKTIGELVGSGGTLPLLERMTQKVAVQMENGNTKFVQAAYVIEPLLGILPAAATGFGKMGDAGSESGTNILKSYNTLMESSLFKSLPNSIKTVTGSLVSGADNVNSFERNLVSLAAASGDLNSVFNSGETIASSLDREYSSMTEQMFLVANATGHTMAETMNFAKSLGTIPGALRTNIIVSEDLGGEMSQLEASMKLASAFGLEHGEVVAGLSSIYMQFGETGDQAFQSLNAIYKAAQDANLPFKVVNETVMASAHNFSLLGDNIQAATNVVKIFGEAFKGSSLGPEGIKQVVNSMVSGIAGMNEGQKAFISAQSGGPSGLAGAFQMDLAIQEGKMDEVLGKTMSAMQRQFGTAPITLKEAGQNPAQAGEFYKQVQYLKQVSGIAKTDQEAYRILEAMKSGVTDQLKLGEKGGQADLSESLERGTEIQTRSNTMLTRINTSLEYQRLIQQKMQQNTAIAALGISAMASKAYTGQAAQKASMGVGLGSGKSTSLESQVKGSIDIGENISEWSNTLKDNLKGYTSPDAIKEIFGKGSSMPKPTAPQGFSGAGNKNGFPAPTPVTFSPAPIDINITLDFPEFNTKIKKTIKNELKEAKSKEVQQAVTGSQ